MTKTLTAVFDGEVLRPEQPVDLLPNVRYVLTIVREEPAEEAESYPLTAIGSLATDMGVEDLSARHHWYAHGGPQEDARGA